MAYLIEKNTVQETLIIPLYGRKVASELYPELIDDPAAARVLAQVEYDFSGNDRLLRSAMGRYGLLEVAQREYDLACEARAYLEKHPDAAVVNLGCGLSDFFSHVDNGHCHGYNLDLPDVIAVRDELLPPGPREANIACDLNDPAWMDAIDARNGAVFIAAGVLYYFTTEQARSLIAHMAERFDGCTLAFDACNKMGLKLMLKTWVREMGITDVGAYFHTEDPERELSGLIAHVGRVTSRSYMNGYRKLTDIGPVFSLLNLVADHVVKMRIVRMDFA